MIGTVIEGLLIAVAVAGVIVALTRDREEPPRVAVLESKHRRTGERRR